MNQILGILTLLVLMNFGAGLAAWVANIAMWILQIADEANVWVSMLVTWPLWILFWRSEVLLPNAINGNIASALMPPWAWVVWAFMYGVYFYVVFRYEHRHN